METETLEDNEWKGKNKKRNRINVIADFVGTTLEVLKNAMAFHEIGFELYCEGKIVVKTGSDVQIISDKKDKVENLVLVTSPLDLHPVPRCLKKPGKPVDQFTSYITTFSEAYGSEMDSDPFTNMELGDICERFQVSIEIWQKNAHLRTPK